MLLLMGLFVDTCVFVNESFYHPLGSSARENSCCRAYVGQIQSMTSARVLGGCLGFKCLVVSSF